MDEKECSRESFFVLSTLFLAGSRYAQSDRAFRYVRKACLLAGRYVTVLEGVSRQVYVSVGPLNGCRVVATPTAFFDEYDRC